MFGLFGWWSPFTCFNESFRDIFARYITDNVETPGFCASRFGSDPTILAPRQPLGRNTCVFEPGDHALL
jgi:hypothetical protein